MPPFPTATLSERHARLRTSFAGLAIDALVVGAGPNLRYLTNHAGTAGLGVVTDRALLLLVDFRYRTAVEMLQATASACPDLKVWPVPGSYDAALADCLEALAPRAVGFESAHVTVARHAAWERACAARGLPLQWVATDRAVEQLRVIKDDEEVARLRAAAAGLGPVAEAAMAAVRPGVAEKEVAGVIEAALRAGGYERPAFETIVASGPMLRFRTIEPGSESWVKVTSSCWTSAASWTDTARTSPGPSRWGRRRVTPSGCTRRSWQPNAPRSMR